MAHALDLDEVAGVTWVVTRREVQVSTTAGGAPHADRRRVAQVAAAGRRLHDRRLAVMLSLRGRRRHRRHQHRFRDLDDQRRGVEPAEAVDPAGAIGAHGPTAQGAERRAVDVAEHVLRVAEDPIELADVDHERIVGEAGPRAEAVAVEHRVGAPAHVRSPAEQVTDRSDVQRLGRPDDVEELPARGRRAARIPVGLEAVEGRLDDQVFLAVARRVDLELIEDVGSERVRGAYRRHRKAVDGHREDDLARIERVDEDVDVVDVRGGVQAAQR